MKAENMAANTEYRRPYELAFKTFVWLYVAAMASLLFLRLPRGEASQRLEE